MLSNFDKKIVYSLLISTTILAMSPLQAMDDQRDQNPPKSIAPKFDPNNNNHSDLDEHPINPVIGVSINPSTEMFSLKNIVQKGLIKLIEGEASNWLEVAQLTLNHIRECGKDSDFQELKSNVYRSILSHVLSTPELLIEGELAPQLYQFFEDSDDENHKQMLEAAIANNLNGLHLITLGKLWITLNPLQVEKQIPATKGKKEPLSQPSGDDLKKPHEFVKFRESIRKAMSKMHRSFVVSEKELEQYRVVLEMIGSLSLSPSEYVSLDMLRKMVQLKNLEEIRINSQGIQDLYPFKWSGIKALDLSHCPAPKGPKVMDLFRLSMMPKLKTLILVETGDLYSINKLLNINSLETIHFSSEVDTSELESKFDVDDKGNYKILTRKTADPTTNRND